MKMHYAELRNRSRLLQSLTGMNSAELEALLPSVEAAWDSFVEETFWAKKNASNPVDTSADRCTQSSLGR